MFKRPLDLCCAGLAFVVLLPVMGVIALLIWITTSRSIIFCQVRPGLNGRPFRMYKFCTMRNDIDATGNLLPDAARMTRFGSALRSTSLDELPELINVLRGEMSLVGPRPLLMEYLPLYSREQMRRHEALPGITGWAQINGRNSLGWEERFRLDVWYVDNWSIGLDLKILFLTVHRVFARDGIRGEGEVTMSKFTGSSAGESR